MFFYKFNAFLIDEISSEKVIKLRKAIESEDKVQAVRLYLQLDKEMDRIRDRYCYNNEELPYKSSFRQIAKDLFRELKKRNLLNHDDLKTVVYILRFISTSDYYQIREMLVKRSLSWYMYGGIPVSNDRFPNNTYPIEFILDYCLKMCIVYLKWN